MDLDAEKTHLADGGSLGYDVLVVATGATLLPDKTDGLTGPGWGEKVFTFHDLPGATALHQVLERFDGGRLVINVADLPVKCPVAPLKCPGPSARGGLGPDGGLCERPTGQDERRASSCRSHSSSWAGAPSGG
ncbi:hypothetical protein ACFYO0_40850 [Streptomyces sp. NPDC006365]|uniref:hypothetical protein n=1 Tax=Streptomyces sp. NPDC006365 TaxID=3364744 RepID=UPI0036800CEA